MSQTTRSTRDASSTSFDGTSSVKTYQDIASLLPHPETVDAGYESVDFPDIASALTIPGDHIDLRDIPWNAHTEQPWRSWRAKFTTTAAVYVLAARHAAADDQQAFHAMYSPPQDAVTDPDASLHWRQEAARVAQANGINAGVAIFHAYRIKPSIVDAYTELITDTQYEETTSDVLLWEWIRRGNWRDYIRWGPHVHIVGLGDTVQKHRGDGLLVRLRTFGDYDGPDSSPRTFAEHRAVAKDAVDHVTFINHDEHDWHAPFYWFGDLQGDSWWEASQHVTDTTLNDIRDVLMNST